MPKYEDMTPKELDELQEQRLKVLVDERKRWEHAANRTEEEWNRRFGHCFPDLLGGSLPSNNSDTETE